MMSCLLRRGRDARLLVASVALASLHMCSELVPAFAQGAELTVAVRVGQQSYYTGDSLHIDVSVTSHAATSATDFFLLLQIPGGDAVAAVTQGGVAFGALSNLAGIQPWYRGVRMPAGVTHPGSFTYQFAGGEPVGTYHVYFAALRSGSLQDGTINPGDLIAVAETTIIYGLPDPGRPVPAAELPPFIGVRDPVCRLPVAPPNAQALVPWIHAVTIDGRATIVELSEFSISCNVGSQRQRVWTWNGEPSDLGGALHTKYPEIFSGDYYGPNANWPLPFIRTGLGTVLMEIPADSLLADGRPDGRTLHVYPARRVGIPNGASECNVDVRLRAPTNTLLGDGADWWLTLSGPWTPGDNPEMMVGQWMMSTRGGRVPVVASCR